jgi:hypothetical protein
VLREMRIMEQPMVRMMDLCRLGGAAPLASLQTLKHGDGQREVLLLGSNRQCRVVWA